MYADKILAASLALLQILSMQPSHAWAFTQRSKSGAPAAAPRTAAALPTALNAGRPPLSAALSSPLTSPVSAALAPALPAAAAQPVFISPALLQAPAAVDAARPDRPLSLHAAAQAKPSLISSLASFARGAISLGGTRRPAAQSLSVLYDNVAARPELGPSAEPAAGNAGKLQASRLAAHAPRYPRVIVIVDPFKDKASQKTIDYIEKLIDNGVQIVFVTTRPDKGARSAESVLLSKLRIRQKNPVLVASYNGARITAHNSRAKNPQPFVEDLPGLPERTIAQFREINERLKEKFELRGNWEEFGVPTKTNPYVYGVRLPHKRIEADKFAAAYNAALRGKGLPYKIELRRESATSYYFFTRSTALKLNTNRILNALYALSPELDPSKGGVNSALRSDQVEVLAPPDQAAGFLRYLRDTLGKDFSVLGVNDGNDLGVALGAILGEEALEKKVVHRHELREYLDWLDRQQRFGSTSGPKSAPFKFSKKSEPAHRHLAFYRGILMKALMGNLYYSMRNGQYHLATLEAAKDLLRDMWRNPKANGVRTNEELEFARLTKGWFAKQKGYLDAALQWLENYYGRNFKNYPHSVREQVTGSLISLDRDRNNSQPLEYVSPFTSRRYSVYVSPDRSELTKDSDGYVLTAHVYRTGKEPYAQEFDESVETNLVGRYMLEAWAQKDAAGTWYVNDEPNPKVKVVFHYNTRSLSKEFTPQELEAYNPQITALIERREADKAYWAWRALNEENNEKARQATKRAGQRALAARRKAAKEKKGKG